MNEQTQIWKWCIHATTMRSYLTGKIAQCTLHTTVGCNPFQWSFYVTWIHSTFKILYPRCEMWMCVFIRQKEWPTVAERVWRRRLALNIKECKRKIHMQSSYMNKKEKTETKPRIWNVVQHRYFLQDQKHSESRRLCTYPNSSFLASNWPINHQLPT